MKRIVYVLVALLAVTFLYHGYGLYMRAKITGYAPWANGYEAIVFIGFVTMFTGFFTFRKYPVVTAGAAILAYLMLFVAGMNLLDPEITPMQPVLKSYWLMIHVAVIVGSYGPLTVGMILGVVALLLMVLTTKKNKKRMDLNIKELTVINELALTAGLVMLTIGNFLGGQWANESWGRYWGWDPKETWALISIMIYAFVLHMRLVPGLRSKWVYNFASVIAFASIMMTYFGVNFYLVGLHSYASGDQVITPSFVWYTVLGVLILGGISFWRYKVHYAKK